MSIHIRLATMQDYPGIAIVGQESQEIHHQAHPTIFQSATPGFTEAYVEDLIEGQQTAVYVAEEEDQILGYAFLHVQEHAWLEIYQPTLIAEITDIAVTEQMRARGLGRQLFAAAQDWAISQGAKRLELVVWEFNKNAFDFYQRRGLQTLARTMSLSLE